MSGAAATGTLAAADLAAKLRDLRAKNEHAYPRDYAAMLGVSEAELTPVFYAGRVQAIDGTEALLQFVSRLPKVKLMARTSYAVLEVSTSLHFKIDQGLFVSDSSTCYIALDASAIARAYFVSPERPDEKAAMLLFGRDGSAVLKIYVLPEEFDAALLAPASMETRRGALAVTDALVAARRRYLGEFIPPFVARENAPRRLIEHAAVNGRLLAFEIVNEALALLVRHTPQKVLDARGWFNILDRDFNLHLKEEAIFRIVATGSEQRQMLRLENAEAEVITLYSMGEP